MWDINWAKLLDAQKKLDSYIFKNKNETYQSTSEKRFLGLIVELSELANATKCFKFWSKKQGNKSEILSEYSDVLHFILSFAVEKNISFDNAFFSENEENYLDQTSLWFFLKLNLSISDLQNNLYFFKWVKLFLFLGKSLDLDWVEIEESYFKKWNINFERQNQDY